ncbi:hypothetical protein ACFLU5_08820 [Bacteroidota bacterium]
MRYFKYLAFIIVFLYPVLSFSQQSYTILQRFITLKKTLNWSDYEEKMSDARKIQTLNSITLSDSLTEYNETLEDFFPLDTSAIYFLDVNFDGRQDLVYHGMVSYTQYSTKIYINVDGVFQFAEEYYGLTKHVEIDHSNKNIRIWVHEPPCCDSYTHSLMQYDLSDKGECLLRERILFLDPNGRRFLGVAEFKTENAAIVNSDSRLYIRRDEFKGHAYFGNPDKTEEMTAKLRDPKVEFIDIADLPAGLKVFVLDQKKVKGETWQFVLTDKAGKLENSLFERWQVRNNPNNQYLGWIKKE